MGNQNINHVIIDSPKGTNTLRKYISRETILDQNGNPFGYELHIGKEKNRRPPAFLSLLLESEQAEDVVWGDLVFVELSLAMLLSEEIFSLDQKRYVLSLPVTQWKKPKITHRILALHKKGFRFCLTGLTEVVDIAPIEKAVTFLKVDFLQTKIMTNQLIVEAYPHKKLIASSIETDDEYLAVAEFGFDYYQGYLVSNPTLNLKEDPEFHLNTVLTLMAELNQEEPDFDKIQKIINQDAGLTLRLLSRGNTMAFARKVKFTSASQVVLRMGIVNLQRWAGALLLFESANEGQQAKLQQALFRALFLEALAKKLEKGFNANQLYYIYLKGILSIFPYEKQAFIFQSLCFFLNSEVIAEAECLLAFNLAFESGDSTEMEFYMNERSLSEEDVMDCHGVATAVLQEAMVSF